MSKFLPLDYCEVELYPIVDSSCWIKRLVPLGVKIAQLRIKDKEGEELEQEIVDSIKAVKGSGMMLFINDYWELAVKHKAYGVHLGQEDILSADLHQLREGSIRLGISTHSEKEAEIAKYLQPSYIAFGPIYETKLKKMAFAPQGADRLKEWKKKYAGFPIVAIGGITLNNAPELFKAEPDFYAVVRDITLADNPEARIKAWQALLSR